MPRIFISYRRDDTKTISGRVHDRLEKVFGDKNVFKDVDDIPAGKDFRRVLQDAANQSDVMLVMIGKQWLNITDASGNRRLDDPDDFVRIEVETALSRDKALVVPVLVQDATMPNSRQLPDSLRELAYKNAVIVRDDPDFHRDMTRLIEQIKTHAPRKRTIPVIPLVALLLGVITIGVAAVLISQLSGENGTTTETPPPQPTTQVASVPTITPTSQSPPTDTVAPTATHTPSVTDDTLRSTPPPTDVLSATPLGGGSGQLAFTSERDGNYEIYVMDINGSNSTRLTSNSSVDFYPVWSPDGSRIAFVANRDDNPEIYTMDADGSNPTNLTMNVNSDSSPSWSPDGSRIAFVSNRDGDNHIYVINTDGSNPIPLTDESIQNSPAWSPDGSRIAFSSSRGGDSEIYIMSADGSDPTSLTNNDTADESPAWSPDGSRIAFYSARDVNYEIYVMNADGSNPTRLTTNSADDFGPAWSPDSSRIAFSSNRDGRYEIYVMNADGSNPTRLTTNADDDFYPVWRP